MKKQESFGKRLKSLILEAGYPSVEKFALENGFDRVTIYRIVEKGADPKLSTVIKILKALEISPNELIKI
ncbi:helix-turn-helix domain-containing protein [Fibrobacterota bacterium]